MAFLSRDDILGCTDILTEEVAVPEWGGSVLVRSLTGRQRDEFEGSLMERRGKRQIVNTANVRAKLVAWSVVGEDGKRLFTDADVTELGDHSAAAMNRVYEVAARLSGLSDEDVEEMVADFGGTNGSSSSSSSPKSSTKVSPNSSKQMTHKS